MAAKRLLMLSALVALSMSTGCRLFCDRHYPCQQPVAYAQPCVPCCPQQGAHYGPPAPPPPQDYSSSGCSCVPNPNVHR